MKQEKKNKMKKKCQINTDYIQDAGFVLYFV